MGEEIGVDVERMQQMASALVNLRDVLAANVPVIVSTMNQAWSSGTGQPISLMALQQAVGKSAEDASDILTRAEMAEAYQAQADTRLSGGMVNIPWDPSAAQLDAVSPNAIAQDLAAAEAESAKNPVAARARIEAIQEEIQDHLDMGSQGTAWLTSFYNQASPQVANLAAILNREDGGTLAANGEPQMLGEQDQKILNTFASGLAYADKNGTLSPTAISAYAKAKNLWSVGMLFQFGPRGSAYGTQETGTAPNVTPNLLAQVTTAIELARKPGGYSIPLTGVSTDSEGDVYVTQTLKEFDPAQAMLTLATQNGVAAREVLGDPTMVDGVPAGQLIASNLMLRPTSAFYAIYTGKGGGPEDGFFPEPFPSSYFRGSPTDFSAPTYAQSHPVTISPSVIGSFFNVATSAPRGTDNAAYDSAEAALNLVAATPPPSQANLPPAIRQALLVTAQRYMYDLGESCSNVSGTGQAGSSSQPAANLVTHLNSNHGLPWVINVASGSGNNTTLATFLQQITSDPTDCGVLMASAKTALSNYFGLMAVGKLPPDLTDPAGNMAGLIGQIYTQSDYVGIQGQAAIDAQHAEYNALLSFAESQVTNIPGIGSTLGTAQSTLGALGLNLPQFSTDNAANTSEQDLQDFAVDQLEINVPMIQGMLNSGAIPTSDLPSQPCPWLQNGQLIFKNPDDVTEFIQWSQTLNTTKVGGLTFEAYVNIFQNAMKVQSDETSINPADPQ
jgi:hypothetical protein